MSPSISSSRLVELPIARSGGYEGQLVDRGGRNGVTIDAPWRRSEGPVFSVDHPSRRRYYRRTVKDQRMPGVVRGSTHPGGVTIDAP
jgi:hypothetical protein